jgi:hypothetical protein
MRRQRADGQQEGVQGVVTNPPSFWRYERRNDKLLPPRQFAIRVLQHGGLVAVVIAVSLGIGVVGYHGVGHLSWIDALLNASMILGGMGPVDPIHTTGGKLFASFYALYSGLVLIAATGILLAPFLHRIVHKFHLEKESG